MSENEISDTPALSRTLKPGTRVLVTGAAGGIGRQIAKTFHAQGARVLVCDVDAAKVLAVDLPAAVERVRTDIADVADVAALFAEVERRFGGLEVLVNNAAITGPIGPVEDNDPTAWLRTINVNLVGQFHCIREAVPLMRRLGGGCIVNMSSIAGRLGFPLRSAYAASKWGVIGLTQSVAMEVGKYNIRVNAILPGIVEGERQLRLQRARARTLGISDEEMSQRVVQNVSMKRKVSETEVAEMALYLCSDVARSVSGTSFGVCGNVETMRRG